MWDLLIRNALFLHVGAGLRFLCLRYLKRDKSITYKKVINGLDKVSSKKDEIFLFHNELKNRLFAVIFVLIIIAIILICS